MSTESGERETRIRFKDPIVEDIPISNCINCDADQANTDSEASSSTTVTSQEEVKKTFPDLEIASLDPFECVRECVSFGFYIEIDVMDELKHLTNDKFYWCMYSIEKKHFYVAGDKVLIDGKECTVLNFSVDDLDQIFMFYSTHNILTASSKLIEVDVGRPSTIVMSNSFSVTYHVQSESKVSAVLQDFMDKAGEVMNELFKKKKLFYKPKVKTESEKVSDSTASTASNKKGSSKTSAAQSPPIRIKSERVQSQISKKKEDQDVKEAEEKLKLELEEAKNEKKKNQIKKEKRNKRQRQYREKKKAAEVNTDQPVAPDPPQSSVATDESALVRFAEGVSDRLMPMLEVKIKEASERVQATAASTPAAQRTDIASGVVSVSSTTPVPTVDGASSHIQSAVMPYQSAVQQFTGSYQQQPISQYPHQQPISQYPHQQPISQYPNPLQAYPHGYQSNMMMPPTQAQVYATPPLLPQPTMQAMPVPTSMQPTMVPSHQPTVVIQPPAPVMFPPYPSMQPSPMPTYAMAPHSGMSSYVVHPQTTNTSSTQILYQMPNSVVYSYSPHQR